MSTTTSIIRSKRFLPLFVTQLCGALNDNVIKNAIVVLLTFHAAEITTIDVSTLANIAAALFILPFFLFSAWAGKLADKYDKSRLTVLVKIWEILICLVAGYGFITSNLNILFASLFMLGAHSTLFGPIKYAILPQHLHKQELIAGNAWIEGGTFLGILIGTLAGGLLIGLVSGKLLVIALSVALATFGLYASLYIPSTAANKSIRFNWNLFTETAKIIHYAKSSRAVFLSIMGISWFWAFGATVLTQIPAFVKNTLAGSEGVVSVLLAFFSIGIALGSLLCERLSKNRIEIGLVPIGSLGLSVFAVDIWFATPALAPLQAQAAVAFLGNPANWRVLMDIVLLGVFGGLYIVPLYALIQTRSEESKRARIIAANNIFNALFMVGSAAYSVLLLKVFNVSIPGLFAITGIINILVALIIYRLAPEFTIRFIAWVLVHTVYKFRAHAVEKIPKEGAALLVCNHVSFADAFVIGAGSPRPVRFVMDHNIFKWPVLNKLFREIKAIPIAAAWDNPVIMERAFDEISAALKQGELVCIFPEGKLSKDGEINEFKSGTTRILERDPVTVMPMALRGLWGSSFSRVEGDILKKPLRRGLFNRIEFVIGDPLTPQQAENPQQLAATVAKLHSDFK